MQRYKFVWPKGHGYECDLSTDEPFMALKTDGYWTEYDGAAKRAITEFNRGRDSGYDIGLDQGRREGQVKVDALKDIDGADLTAEYNRGYNRAKADIATESFTGDDVARARTVGYNEAVDAYNTCKASDDQMVKKLLNELYHDRARLEKVVAGIAKTAAQTAADVADLLTEMNPGEVAQMTQAMVDVTVSAGMLKQFADTHGE